MRRALLFFLPFSSACLEPAWAQSSQSAPRPPSTAGANPDPRAGTSGYARAQISRNGLLQVLERSQDAGASASATPDASVVSQGNLWGPALRSSSFGPGGLGLRGAGMRSGTAEVQGLGRLGTMGHGAGVGSSGGTVGGSGAGRLGINGPRRDARFEEPTVQGPLAAWQVVSELSHVGPRVHNCLVRAGHTAPVTLTLRFRLEGPQGVQALSADPGAPESVLACLREHLAQGLFGAGPAATAVTVRFRFGL